MDPQTNSNGKEESDTCSSEPIAVESHPMNHQNAENEQLPALPQGDDNQMASSSGQDSPWNCGE